MNILIYDKCQLCEKIGKYGKKEAILKLVCEDHNINNDLNIKHNKCVVKNCLAIPTYGYNSSHKRITCTIHKSPNMVRINSDLCQHFGCRNTFECDLHINIYKYCELCENHATFGYNGEFKTRCAKHKSYSMTNDRIIFCKKRLHVTNKLKGKIIHYQRCKNIAKYGTKKAIHCIYHKLDDENFILKGFCIKCELIRFVNENNICINCIEN